MTPTPPVNSFSVTVSIVDTTSERPTRPTGRRQSAPSARSAAATGSIDTGRPERIPPRSLRYPSRRGPAAHFLDMDFHHRRPPVLGQSHPTTTAHKPRRGPAFSTVDQSPAPARHLPLDQPCPAVSRQRNPHSPHTAELDSIEELDQGRTSRNSSQRRRRPPAPLPKTAPIHPSDARSTPATPSTTLDDAGATTAQPRPHHRRPYRPP